jgi:methionine-rich copper-binding protein CopC
MLVAGLAAAGLILVSPAAVAEDLHIRASTPAAGAVLTGSHAEYVIRFDGLVDHESSRIYIVQSGRVVQSLIPRGDSAPEVLFAGGEMPAPGDYQLQWQARSPTDAVVSSGVIPFSVSR